MAHDDGQERFRAKLQELSERFVTRSLSELDSMQTFLTQAKSGDTEAAQQLLLAAHRISGSGAMLGFATISEYARNIERILRTEPRADDVWQQLGTQLQGLDVAVKAAEQAPLP